MVNWRKRIDVIDQALGRYGWTVLLLGALVVGGVMFTERM